MKKMAKIRDFFLNLGLKWVWLNKSMAPYRDPRINTNISVEQMNSTLLDKATDLLGFINGAIGFEGTGSKNFTVIQNGNLDDINLAIHTIETNSDQPAWVEAQNVLFQAAPYRLNQIKEKLEANIENIKNDIAANIENLFSVVQTKEGDFDPLEAAVSNASDYNSVISSGKNLENAVMDFDKIARDIADIYFSTQFSLGGLDLRIEEEIFGLLGGRGQEYSNGSTDRPQYFISFSKRDISKTEIYNRFTNEIKQAYEAENGSNSWSKENYLKKMFANKQIELSPSTIKAILADKNRNQKEFTSDSQILALVRDFDDLMRIIGATDSNRETSIEMLFKGHLSKYAPPTQLIDINDTGTFIEQGLKQLEIFTRDAYGDQRWEDGLESFSFEGKNLNINFNVLNLSVQNQIAGGKLKLDSTLIDKIIQEKNLSSETLTRFTSSEDFLKILTKEELYSIAGSHYGLNDNKSISLKLFTENLKINTPIYFQDQRSVHDILVGKNNNNGDANNLNKIFSSLENQIKGLGEATKNLLSQGYEKPPRNNLQKYLRNNPLEAAQYLENFMLTNNESLSDNEKLSINSDIRKMIGRLNLIINEQINESNKQYSSEILELKKTISGYKSQSGSNIANIFEKFNSLNPDLKKKFNFEPWPENLSAYSAENYNSIKAEIAEDAKFFNSHKSLFASEMQEANKINAQQFGKKLAEPLNDGSLPEDNQIIPPSIGPSNLSAVIASIGRQALEKADSIINSKQPDENWLAEQSSFLRKLDQDLQTLPSDTTRSQQFINALKNAFIPIIKKFLENKSDTKTLADNAKSNLVNNNFNIKKLNILSGTDPGFAHGGLDLDSELDTIQTNLSELNNLETVDLNANKICKAGLENTKTYLENKARQLQEQILNPPEGSRIEDLQRQLGKIYDLLFGDNGNSTNPEAGSILEKITSFTNDVNSACSNKPSDVDKLTYLNTKQVELINNYKEALVNFSNDITNIEDNDNFDIEKAFKDAIDNASNDFDGDGVLDPALDSDGNGVNDFMDLKNLANIISGGTNSLANTLENVFGTKNEAGKSINQMGIRRLILMMFIFTIFESGEWEFLRQEADPSKYQTV